MDNEIKDKLKEIAPQLLEDKDLPLFLKLEEIAESLEKIAEKKMPEMKMEMPEVHKIQIEGIENLKGEKGDDYVLTEKDKKEIASKIRVPIVEKIVETIIEKQPIITNEIKEVAMSDTPEQVKEKLLEVGLTIEDIADLRKELDDLKKKWNSRPVFGGGGLSRGVADSLYAPIGSTSAALTPLTATGDVDDSNVVFTFVSAPTIVVVNGANYINGHGVTIVGTTATLDNPVGINGFIYGL